MTAKIHRRWYLMLSSHKYRPGGDPLDLLDVVLACCERDGGATLRTVVAEIERELVALATGEHGGLAGNPLAAVEVVAAIETTSVAFAAHLTRGEPPTWLLREGYLGLRLRQIATQLWRPAITSPAAELDTPPILDLPLARFVSAIDVGRWPARDDCEAIAAALAACPDSASDEALTWARETGTLLGAFAQDGVAACQLRYMAAVIERARLQTLGQQAGLLGALDHVADDVARPLLRVRRVSPARVSRTHRSRLSRARKEIMKRWMGQRKRSRWPQPRIDRLDGIPSHVVTATRDE